MSAHVRFAERYCERAIVTGASSGIIEAFAHAVAARGVRQLLVVRRSDELQRVAAAIVDRHQGQAECLALDLGDANFIDQLGRACACKDVGLVVSNAAFNPEGAFLDYDAARLEQMLDVNCRASLLLAVFDRFESAWGSLGA